MNLKISSKTLVKIAEELLRLVKNISKYSFAVSVSKMMRKFSFKGRKILGIWGKFWAPQMTRIKLPGS